MGRVFAITSSTNTVVLDGSGRGTVTFTVTNTGSEPRRVRPRLVPEGSTEAEWLSLSGDDERRLETDSTEQFAVQVAPGEGAAAGRYGFRFDAVGVENPDDETVEGPSVAFEVAAAEKKKAFPWWIVVVGGVLVAGLAVALLWDSGPPELGEACTGVCAEGLTCGPDHRCAGDIGFEGCVNDHQCAEGLRCAREEGGPGRCVGRLGAEGCDSDLDCGDGLGCENGTCLGGLDFDPCANDSECIDELMCWNGSCKADTTGQQCSGQANCGPGQRCLEVGNQKVCLRIKGQACDDFWQCASQSCEDGACVSLANGERCTNSAQCDSNICDQGKCRAPMPCGPQGQCPDNMTCYKGFCKRGYVFTSPGLLQELEKAQRRHRTRIPAPRPGGGS